MKRILLATALGLGVLTFTMASATDHQTAPVNLKYDTVPTDTIPQDTTQQPAPDTTTLR